MKREFEELFRRAARIVGLSTTDKTKVVNTGHRVDSLRDNFFTASGAPTNTLDGVANQIQWLIDILNDPEVREEWRRLYEEECRKPGNEKGLNAYQDWPLRRIAYETVQKRREKIV